MAEQTRPPIVTILGHVDHGKTSLLDFIRKSSVASKEHGGITQHIGAYQITHNSLLITFIDTPGHAAFEKMRSRGANVADIAILVVAVDDGVMPQTIEAIKHIEQAKVPAIVAVNKIDLPGINVKVQLEKIKRQLSDNKILVEEYGGKTPIVPVSAKSGEGVDALLEMILLVAEVSELKGDPQSTPEAIVIEANIDKFKGPIATLLVRNGTLRKGDKILVGGIRGNIRNLINYQGEQVEEASLSMPVEVLGLENVPPVGSLLDGEQIKEDKKPQASLVDRLKQGQPAVLKLVLKADKQGSLEAITSSLDKFNKEAEHIKIISSGTGDINEADIKMAQATRAIVIGFNCKISPPAAKMKDGEHVLIRTYNVIYELLEELEEVVSDLQEKGALEEVFGSAQILQEFAYGKADRIAGCRVLDGSISKGSRIRVVRKNEIIGETRIKSMKKLKEEVSKIEKGEECGIMFDPPVNFQIGDIIESYRTIT